MGDTLVQKVMARAAGQDHVAPGEIITCQVDLVMAHDSSGPRRWGPRLKELGVGVWDADKIVIMTDHFVPAADPESAAILKITRDFVAEQGIKRFHDMEGICHVVLPEYGYLKPGMFVAGADSHSPTGGAFGCYMAGFGAMDMTAVVATGETWVTVPDTIRVNWDGVFGTGVAAKDIMLFLCATLGMGNNFKVIEYGGSTVRAMPMEERMVLSNMAAELGAESGMIEPDEITLSHIRAAGADVSDDALAWQSDADASYEAVHHFDASDLVPYVAAPHSPANAAPIDDHQGTDIHQAYIGACVGAKLEDLHMAARVLKGKKVSKGTRLMVAPASTKVTAAAAADGTLQTLTEAGAMLLSTGCGACAGLGSGLLSEGETCISTTNRNFKGRMGHSDSYVYLASPYTVAASAIEGRIADPRHYLGGT